ncbi:hypothetical protein IW261DRAFT_1423374 [Armillaria novae-zelandiae]|uniref:Uncharacterized protein n=1 Tax=Armillaria novae-zelandiae TaxID=153914 RepID=A0AA39NXF4_9AGAR|nr:hypothetical protein IW261DRAFT_1423374 [Armillaria novae-zelandiae]
MDGERAALWILIGRHGGSPSWVEHLGGHDIHMTLNILNLGSRSIEVKEEEVDELIAWGVLYTINSDPANYGQTEQHEADTGAYPSDTEPANAQPPQGGNDNLRPWETFGSMGKTLSAGALAVAYLNVCPRVQKYDNSPGM